ncbi:MAG: hypothetical protein ABJE47_18020 [bacterium]
MGDPTSAAARELPLLLGATGAASETLMLVSVPDSAGVVHVRSWSADNWSAAPTVRAERASVLLDWLEGQAKHGRTMNQAMYGVRLWLRGEGSLPR